MVPVSKVEKFGCLQPLEKMLKLHQRNDGACTCRDSFPDDSMHSTSDRSSGRSFFET